MKKSRLLAPFLMLLAGAVASITMFMLHYSTWNLVCILLLVLMVFYIIGYFIQKMLDKFNTQNQKTVFDEGEVIEKEVQSEEEPDNENKEF